MCVFAGVTAGAFVAQAVEKAKPPTREAVPDDEFRRSGDGFVCFNSRKPRKKTGGNYDNCLVIGPIRVKQTMANVESLLGSPIKLFSVSQGVEQRVYLLPAYKSELPYVVVTYKMKRVTAVQFHWN